MTSSAKETEKLFSYGTLQTEPTQLATFGRKLEGKTDTLVGYRVKMIRVQNPEFEALSGAAHHLNIECTGLESDLVEGAVLTVTGKELEQADAYEKVADYERVLVQLKSGTKAWVYLSSGQ